MYFLKRMKQAKVYWGLCVGLVIVVLHFVVRFFSLKQYLDGNQISFTPYNQWIGYHTDSWTILFYLIIPITSCLSFNQTVFNDIKTGFVSKVVNKMGYKKYILSNTLYTFLGAFFTIVIPLFLNFLLFYCTFPDILPDRLLYSDNFIAPNVTYFINVYYKSPLVLIIFYCIFAGLIGGMCSLASLALMAYIRNYFTVFVGPFLITLIMDVIAAAFPFVFAAPTLFIIPMSPVVVPNIMIVALCCLIIGIMESYVVYMGIRKNVYL